MAKFILPFASRGERKEDNTSYCFILIHPNTNFVIASGVLGKFIS